MLKRSLGDKTWNAGEITAEMRSLNEDVQTYLSIHAVSFIAFTLSVSITAVNRSKFSI
jgi:hypothetical protein